MVTGGVQCDFTLSCLNSLVSDHSKQLQLCIKHIYYIHKKKRYYLLDLQYIRNRKLALVVGEKQSSAQLNTKLLLEHFQHALTCCQWKHINCLELLQTELHSPWLRCPVKLAQTISMWQKQFSFSFLHLHVFYHSVHMILFMLIVLFLFQSLSC